MSPVVLFGLNNPMTGSPGGAVPAIPPVGQPPQPPLKISGISRDSTGAALGAMTCTLFRLGLDSDGRKVYTQVDQTVSDGSGNYSFFTSMGFNYRVTTDMTGVAGISADTLLGT